MLTKQRLIDYIISAAVFSQSILVILELYWVDVVQMNEEMATTYRVLLTAVPMSIALLLGYPPSCFVCDDVCSCGTLPAAVGLSVSSHRRVDRKTWITIYPATGCRQCVVSAERV